MEKGLETPSAEIHMILKHKPVSDVSFNASLNILYISHHELQQRMFLKSHIEHEVTWLK